MVINEDKNLLVNKTDDINITQDVKVIQQILNKIVKHDNNGVTLNVVTIGQITNSYQEKKTKDHTDLAKVELTEIEKLIIALLELVPDTSEGRLKTLNRLVVSTCLSFFDNDAEAAEYLGISRRVMSYNKNKKFSKDRDNT